MKRSQINSIIRQNLAFLDQMKFRLPPFAFWSPEEWRAKGPECREIVRAAMGWDITDFGSGDFEKVGLFLFTIRNGTTNGSTRKTYGEKLLIVEEGQVTPTHLHYQKMEDIINRGGGNLITQLWNSTSDFQLSDTEVTVSVDGVERCVPPGGTIVLKPGESVTLPPELYHKFWGEAGSGKVLVGEVSKVNDDRTDNHFNEPVGRFPQIIDDEPSLHLLVTDYPQYYRYAKEGTG